MVKVESYLKYGLNSKSIANRITTVKTQSLLKASQVLLPLGHWCLWQRSGRYIIYRPQQNLADSLSLGGDPLRTGLQVCVD